MSLRTRLVVAMLVLVALGLVVSGVATFVALQSFLLRRVDQQLVDLVQPVARLLAERGGERTLPAGIYAEVRRPNGAVGPRLTPLLGTGSLPDLPDDIGLDVGDTRRLFTVDERIAMLTEACEGYANVRIDVFEGLLTDFCQERGATAIVKGLRAVSDFDYELQMAQMNSSLAEIETVFVPTSPAYSFLASSLVKEVATFGGDVSSLVPPRVLDRLTARLEERRTGQE